MCPEAEIRITLILQLRSQMSPGVEKDRRGSVWSAEPATSGTCGDLTLLPQRHSQQSPAEGWGLSLPLHTVDMGPSFNSGLLFTETNTYTFFHGHHVAQAEPFFRWTPGKCGLVP